MPRDAMDDVRAGRAHFDWETITAEHDGHVGEFRVFGDALKIEGVREVFSAAEAQEAADLIGAVLPTPKLLDLRYQQADVKLAPKPKYYPGGMGMDARDAIVEHSRRVDAELGGRAGLVADVGKHWVLHSKVRPGKSVLYGWHVPYEEQQQWRGIKVYPSVTGEAGHVIQLPSDAHDEHHRDYSMTLVLVDETCEVDGRTMATAEVYGSAELCGLVTADGQPLRHVRMPERAAPEERQPVSPPERPRAEAASPRHPTLRLDDRGPAVERLQQLLVTAGFDLSPYGADGHFGAVTDRAVRRFQRSRGLEVDGLVGRKTWTALLEGRAPVEEPEAALPGAPPFAPLRTNAERARVFGSFAFVPAPRPGSPESIRITDEWPEENMITVTVPQLAKIPGIVHRGRRVGAGPSSGRVQCHRLVAEQLKNLWQAWEDDGLLDRILTWAGLWNPRFIRGGHSILSNHAFGSAFDINAPWNALGATPAALGERGSVVELVAAAHRFGFYWGGHFSSRPDGMHFEAAKGIE